MHNKLPGPYRATMEQDTQGGTMEIDLHFYTLNIFLRGAWFHKLITLQKQDDV